MRKNEWIKAVIVAGLCLAGFACNAQQESSSQQGSDPVADAARKAREDKKNAPKPKRVFTDDDVKQASPATLEKQGAANATDTTTPPATGTESQKAAGATKAGGVEKEDPNSEKAWRKRFAEQHAKIARVEKELDLLQREVQKSQVQYYADPQKAMNEQNNRAEVNEKTAQINAKKKELEQLRQELDDMETELRRAGGDPGWAK